MWGKKLSDAALRLNNVGSMAVLLIALSATSPVYAAEYMPPPLFGGGGGDVVVTKPAPTVTPALPLPVDPAPQLAAPKPKPVPESPAISEINQIPTNPPGVKGDIPLPPNVLDRDNTVKKTTPSPYIDNVMASKPAPEQKQISTDDLIKHPANHVDPLAKNVSKPSQIRATQVEPQMVPEPAPSTTAPETRKSPAGLARPIIDGPGARAEKQIKKSTKKSPSVAKKTVTDPLPMQETPTPSPEPTPMVNAAPVTEVVPSPIVVAPTSEPSTPPEPVAPKKKIEKPGIKSPSPTVRKIIEQNPKVMVYSRDKETGEFKRVTNSDQRVISNKGQSTTLQPSKKVVIPPPELIDDFKDLPPAPANAATSTRTTTPKKEVSKKRPTSPLPPVPIPSTSLQDSLKGRLTPLSEEDLNRAVASITTDDPFVMTPKKSSVNDVDDPHVIHATKIPSPQNSTDDDVTTHQPSETRNPSDLSSVTPLAPSQKINSSDLPNLQKNLSNPIPISSDNAPTIIFSSGGTELSKSQKSQIDDDALTPLSKNTTKHIEIRSYASPIANERSSERRIALARGLAVREYLKIQGIASDRIELKVLGTPVDQTNADRVELVIR